MDDYTITYHPWKMLKENIVHSFPDEKELVDMKKTMDGINIVPSKLARAGMKKAGIRNIYELIVWGLGTGIIKDEPIKKVADKLPPITGTYESYPRWLALLNGVASGLSDGQIQKQGLSKHSIDNYRNIIQNKFGIGDSQSEFIRFAIAAISPISGPDKLRGFKPHVSWAQKAGIGSKLPVMISKYRPVDIDPDFPVHDIVTDRERDISDYTKRPKNYSNLPKRDTISATTKRNVLRPQVKSTSIQTALWLLGVDRDVMKDFDRKVTSKSKAFWDRPEEHLWNLLELAKRRYELEMAHAHPDRGGNAKRAAQLNAAWSIVKKLFARKGFVLHK